MRLSTISKSISAALNVMREPDLPKMYVQLFQAGSDLGPVLGCPAHLIEFNRPSKVYVPCR